MKDCKNYCLALFGIIATAACSLKEQQEPVPYYMARSFPDLALTWDEGIPLGNAMLGALVWQKDGKLRLSLDRADLWDLRSMENLNFEKYDFDWVVNRWNSNEYGEVQRQFDLPYDTLAGPSKIPGAALEFDIAALGEVEKVKLDLKKAICTVKWKSGVILRTFVHATEPVGWYQFENLKTPISPTIVPPPYVGGSDAGVDNPVTGQDLRRLGYPAGALSRGDNNMTYEQEGWDGFRFEVNTRWTETANQLQGSWSISSAKNGREDNAKATQVTTTALEKGMENYQNSHLNWWEDFWSQSAILLPDSLLQNQYYMEMYKLGAAARQGAPPISLQSVWTADNGKLPPWKGDFHHDLNTQLSYWPTYTGNHLALEQGFIDWLNQHKPTFKKYTSAYFETEGLNVPGVTTLEGDPMGGWIQYAFGPTVSAWLGHHFYLHWRYSMDREFLENEAYPWIREVAIFLDEISIMDANGNRKLPLSSSPEIHNNEARAWFDQMSNYDLALVRWTFTAAAELAKELDLTKEAEEWANTLNEWPEYAIDETGLMVAPGEPLRESHRHFSQIMAIHPLGLIDIRDGDADKEIIENTISHLDELGSSGWTGYSFAWLGNLKARAGDGEGAAKALQDFASSFVLPNSFHVNGDQSGTGKSNFTYRPFTLEGNFAFAAGIQEMLIQSHTGLVRLFPAIPADWQDISFSSLRTQGAFLVSATWVNGNVDRVEITAEKGGTLRMENPFEKAAFTAGKAYQLDGSIIQIQLNEAEQVTLTRQNEAD
ncbi:hypothetical protein SAMN04488057_10551 [Cyclobacterium lianum]|uniref:Alpha-L-fucosidase 2 n=2 Tax=Cyclobacterium lianum TaxID=388280 RepID=A0A1M7N4H1_9BACT|nr:hypothetical protein SAMN04488057_10551 [Cyclobacterium lianum]